MFKKIILSFALFLSYTHSAHATQPCRAYSLTKEQALAQYDNIVVVKVKSGMDETDWFTEKFKDKYQDQPEEIQKFEEMFLGYITYEATILQSFQGSLKGDIKLAEIREAFSSYDGALITGFYYILGLNEQSDNEINFLPENVILMPDCTAISVGFNKFHGGFIDKTEEFRK